MFARFGVTSGLVAFAAAAGVASAEEAGRYAIGPAEDGFVRMDTATGNTAHCGLRDGTWFCEPIAEHGPGLDEKVDALAATVRDLSGKVDGLAASIEALSAPAAAAAAEPDAETRPRGFAGQVIDRFVAMVRVIKHRGDS